MPINTISQTISTIPEAGHRGVDVQTQFVIKQEDFQDHLQGTTVTELNTFKDQLNSRIGEINSTATTMNDYANTASTKASQASASATSASTSANTATTKASQASASANTATTKASEASTSANTASTQAGIATTKASEASTSASSATTSANTATTKASEASASATSASQSLASMEGILATLPDGSVNDTLIGTDKAFSNQSLVGAFGNLSSPLLDLPLKNSLTMKAGVGSTTFTRASTATYIDRYGVLKTAGIDVPRFEKGGYLNEGSSTNLLTYSDNMLTGYIYRRATLTLSTTELSPDGITYASEFRENNEIGGSYVYKSLTFTAGTTYTHSVFAKSINGQNLTLYSFTTSTGFDKTYSVIFDLTNGTISGSGASNAKIVPLPNGWYRCSITATCTTTATGNTSLVDVGTNYDSPDYGLYIFGAQLEALPFATSYIPTTSSQVTRSADVLQVTRENNFPNAENNAQGYSIVYKYDTFGTAAGTRILWSLYTSSNNYVRATLGTNTIANSISNYIGANSNITSITNLDSRKVVQTQNNNSLKQYINGLLADNDVNTTGKLSETGNSLTNLTIGSFYGHISNFKVYDFELTPVEAALL